MLPAGLPSSLQRERQGRCQETDLSPSSFTFGWDGINISDGHFPKQGTGDRAGHQKKKKKKKIRLSQKKFNDNNNNNNNNNIPHEHVCMW
jgi:hypothetical protein